ncbi:hypothetical protein [Desulfoscipio gibsoniae]
MIANAFSMLYSIGAAPDNLTGGSGDTPVHATTFGTNKKTTQYIFLLGGLSLISILVYAATLALLVLNRKVVFRTGNSVYIFCVAQHLVKHRLAPAFFARGGWDVLFKKKIGNVPQTFSGEILPIHFLYN